MGLDVIAPPVININTDTSTPFLTGITRSVRPDDGEVIQPDFFIGNGVLQPRLGQRDDASLPKRFFPLASSV